MGNYPTSYLTPSELAAQVLADPQATERERDMAERIEFMLNNIVPMPLAHSIGRGDRG